MNCAEKLLEPTIFFNLNAKSNLHYLNLANSISINHHFRMLHMRNMPFVTGRVINWMEEIAPVATDELKGFVEEYRNGSGSVSS